MPDNDIAIEDFIENNQISLLQLLFFETEGEWDQVTGENPNNRIIEILGNPQNINELISSIENKIQTVVYHHQIAKYISSLKKAVENYKDEKSECLSSVSPRSPRIAFNTTEDINSSVLNLDSNRQLSGVFFGSDRVSPETSVSRPKVEDSCFKKLSRLFTNCCDSSEKSR